MQKQESEIINTVSLLEIIGVLPYIVALLAVVIGLSTLISRRKTWIQSSVIFQIALATWGLSITCWRLYSSNIIYYDAYPDSTMWLSDFAMSWTAAALSLTGVTVGLALIGVAWLLKKPE